MINNRIRLLRDKLARHNVDAYIVPSSDPHQSEYLPDHWQLRKWISGFTGSAGTVVITQDHAGLWADSRYFIQAEKELSTSEFVLHKQTDQFYPEYITWLIDNLKHGSKVIIDAQLFSLSQENTFESLLTPRGIQLKLESDFMNDVWKNRPELPLSEVFEHNIKYAGIHRLEKLNMVREEMARIEVDCHLITTLDDIAWLFNLRGSDVECNPVFMAFALIHTESAMLFMNKEKLSNPLLEELTNQGIEILPYEKIEQCLRDLPAHQSILVDNSSINVSLYRAIVKAKIIEGEMPSRMLKSIKNETELGHTKLCMVKDGIALTHAFYWLEETLESRDVAEYEFARKISDCRGQQDGYFGESFSAIVGYKGNGAIVHYRPEKDNSAAIQKNGVLLVDSGGQYIDGTTDITRTIALGKPTSEEINANTRVLKGHIALASAVFPAGTKGVQLDILARQFLWEDGLNFLHGTGHGVGFFLNVHEPPQGISPGISVRSKTAFRSGMITSNEPGYYKENDFGIRIENLVVTVPANHEGFFRFETITLFPIDIKLINKSLLSDTEVKWFNDYQDTVYQKLSPLLEKKYQIWLKDKCEKI